MTWPTFAAVPSVAGRRQRVLVNLGSSPHPADELQLSFESMTPGRSPLLHAALQDLADMIIWDLHEACAVLDDPNLWYPGVDEGIEPVTDDHVKAVSAAVQRELDREPRALYGRTRQQRPAPVLADLPWRIQRAFTERRRLRFAEWGVRREDWEQNRWLLSRVPVDDWWPPWIA